MTGWQKSISKTRHWRTRSKTATVEGRIDAELFAKHREEGGREGGAEGEPGCSVGLLTSLEDSGESSVVVAVVETVRPEL